MVKVLTVDVLLVGFVEVDVGHLAKAVEECPSDAVRRGRGGRRRRQQILHRGPGMKVSTPAPLAVDDVEPIPQHAVADLVGAVIAHRAAKDTGSTVDRLQVSFVSGTLIRRKPELVERLRCHHCAKI